MLNYIVSMAVLVKLGQKLSTLNLLKRHTFQLQKGVQQLLEVKHVLFSC
jgi:hypothetical protein